MNIVARLTDFIVAQSDPVEAVNRAATRQSLRDERQHWREELRKAEKRARLCRDELDKLDEIEACS